MNRSTPGVPVYHQLPESTQTHVHWVSDAIQASHPLSSLSLFFSHSSKVHPLLVFSGNPLQYSCLENPVDRGAWWAAVHRVTQSRTRLKQLSSSSSTYAYVYHWLIQQILVYTCMCQVQFKAELQLLQLWTGQFVFLRFFSWLGSDKLCAVKQIISYTHKCYEENKTW